MRSAFHLAALFGLVLLPPSGRAEDSNSPPVQLTAQQDHQRIMDLLHMTSFRRRKDDANYDEAKANPYPNLPDPLTLNNGTRVTTPDAWWKLRRPEIVEDFDREIYGRTPKVTPEVKWEVASITNRVLTNATSSFAVVEKQLRGHVDNSSYTNISITIQLSLTLPAEAAGPSPVITVLSPGAFRGGFFGGRGLLAWQAMVLSNGWGFATLNTYSIQADGGRGIDGRHHRAMQQGPAAQTG
jgi:hypothetical protein